MPLPTQKKQKFKATFRRPRQGASAKKESSCKTVEPGSTFVSMEHNIILQDAAVTYKQVHITGGVFLLFAL